MRLAFTLALVVLCTWSGHAYAGWWQEVPATQKEIETITRLAEKELRQELLEAGFDSISIKKQEVEYQVRGEPEKDGKSENVRLYGTFPDSLNKDDYRERYAIRCSIHAEYVDSENTTSTENCEQGIERYLTYEGINSEVRLDKVVELDLAKAFIEFLSTQVGPVRGQPLITQSDFSKFDEIGIRRGQPKRVVVYWSGGSTTYGLSFIVVNKDGYSFEDRLDESYVSD